MLYISIFKRACEHEHVVRVGDNRWADESMTEITPSAYNGKGEIISSGFDKSTLCDWILY